MMIKWITLHVRDFEASKRFYTEYLSLPLRQSFSPRPGMSIAFLGQEDETQLELILDENLQLPAVAPGTVSIGIPTSRYDALLETARETGILAGEPEIMGGYLACFFVTDPDGTRIQVIQDHR
jgi:predicted enzyme related to lactoylglutathione lyase